MFGVVYCLIGIVMLQIGKRETLSSMLLLHNVVIVAVLVFIVVVVVIILEIQ